MKVSWLVHSRLQPTANGGVTSDMASTRYRVLTPIRGMGGDFVHRLTDASSEPGAQLREALDADIMVFSKAAYDVELALAREARAAGKTVIFDVCDDHFQSDALGGLYRALAGLADAVVCNGPQMAAAAAPYVRRPAVVIEDPYEGPRGDPRFAPGEVLKLLWFGHPTNLDTLGPAVRDLAPYAGRRPLALTVLTEARDDLNAWVRRLGEMAPPGFAMTARPWSLAAQWTELAACDAVVIPTLDAAPKRAKSANRMIESLWAGRPVAAQPLPAYAPFARWTPVRTTLSEALDELFANRDEVPGRIAQAQQEIAGAYDPTRLAHRWADLFRATAAAD